MRTLALMFVCISTLEGQRNLLQANKEGSVQERASRLSTDTAGTVQSQGAEPASAAAMAESAEAPGAPDMGVTDLALEHKYAQEMGKPLPGHQNIVHQNTGDCLQTRFDAQA